MTSFDPDPRYVPEDELWDPVLAEWVPRPSALWAFLAGVGGTLIFVGLLVALVLWVKSGG